MKRFFKLTALVGLVVLVGLFTPVKVQACSMDAYGNCQNAGTCAPGYACTNEGTFCTCSYILPTAPPAPTPTKTPAPAPTGIIASPTSVPIIGCSLSIECGAYCAGSPCGGACSASCNTTTHQCTTTCPLTQPCPGGTYGPWGPCSSGGYQTRDCINNPLNYQIQVCPAPGNTGVPGSTNTPVPPAPTAGPPPTLGPVPSDPALNFESYNPGTGTTPITATWTNGSGLQVWDSSGVWYWNTNASSPITVTSVNNAGAVFGIPPGRTAYARTTFNFVTFSNTVSILVLAPTSTPTPTPTTAPWVKLKDASFISTRNLNNNIPLVPVAYDYEDSTQTYFNINSGGVTRSGGIVAAPVVNIGGINLTAKANEKDWRTTYSLSPYAMTPSVFYNVDSAKISVFTCPCGRCKGLRPKNGFAR